MCCTASGVLAREFGAATEAQRCAHIQWWSAKLLRCWASH
jgi:hypothetical protein